MYDIITATTSADATVASLCRELSSLKGILSSISRVLQECSATFFALAHVENDLWDNIQAAVEDCQHALVDLDSLIDSICGSRSSRLIRKSIIATKLALHRRDLSELQDRITKSNYAMQTALAVINVYELVDRGG